MFDSTMASPASSTSSSSSSSSSVHHASLVDPATHSPVLLELIDVKISSQVIEYVVDTVVDTVDYAMGRPSTSRGRPLARRPEHSKFTEFVTNVLQRAEVTMPTLLVALVYVHRAKPHLHIGLEQWALERVFLGSLIVASKYLNDSTLKNVHWALCTGVFGKRDVGRIEREYLDVLNFELKVTEDDVLSHHQGLASAAHLSLSPRPTKVAISVSHEQQQQLQHEYSERRHSHSRHHEQHQRHPSPPQHLPELDSDSSVSSSPSSDCSSLYSPRTPETMASSPPPMHKPSEPPVARKALDAAQFHKRTVGQLLRGFPTIPRMHT